MGELCERKTTAKMPPKRLGTDAEFVGEKLNKDGEEHLGKKTYAAQEAHVLIPPGGGEDCIGELSDQEFATYLQSEAMKNARRCYRIKEGYCIREICGEGLVIPVSQETIEENQMSILSPVARFLWDRLEKGQTFGDLLAAVLAEYEVGRDEAAADITEFLTELNARNYLATVEESVK